MKVCHTTNSLKENFLQGSGARNRKVPMGKFLIRKFSVRKFPINRGSDATSKTGLALGFCGDSFSASPCGEEFTVGGGGITKRSPRISKNPTWPFVGFWCALCSDQYPCYLIITLIQKFKNLKKQTFATH